MLYWVGPGNLLFKDEVTRPGEPLPEGLLDATVASLQSKGKVATEPAPAPFVPPTPVERLQAELAAVRAELASAQDTIAALTEQLTAPAPKGGKNK